MTIYTRRFLLLLISFLVLPLVVTPRATTYYVATTGSDSNPGTLGSPFRTFSHAVTVLTAGDTLYARGGTYSDQISSGELTASGTAGNPILLAGYASEVVTIQSDGSDGIIALIGRQYLEFQDLIIDGVGMSAPPGVAVHNAIFYDSSNYFTFRRVTVRNAWLNGFLSSGVGHRYLDLTVHGNGRANTNWPAGANGIYGTDDNALVQGGSYYDNLCYGIRFVDSAAAPQRSENNIIERTRVYTNGYGLGLSGASQCGSGGGGVVLGDSDNTLRNSLLYGNLNGLEISGLGGKTTQRILSYFNTIYGSVGGGILIGVNAGSNLTQVVNTILYGNGSGIVSYTASGTVLTTNLLTDPSFTNAGSGVFTLLPGSAAIAAGTTLASVPTDFTGATRPSPPSIGAYDVAAPTPPSGLKIPVVDGQFRRRRPAEIH